MKHPLFALAAAALAAACHSARPVSEPAAAADPAHEEQAPMPRLGGAGKADSLFLVLERTPCFGTCKAYRIEVYRSGFARYEGRAHVEKEGRYTASIGQDTLLGILYRAEELGFFGLEGKYDAPVTDLPSTVLRIQADGRSKEVLGRVAAPQAFKRLADEIEGLLLPADWRPESPQR